MPTLSAIFQATDNVSPAMQTMVNSGKQATDMFAKTGEASASAFRQASSGADSATKSVQQAASSTDTWTAAIGGFDKSAMEAIYTTEELVEMGYKTKDVLTEAAKATEEQADAFKQSVSVADEFVMAIQEQETELEELQKAYIGAAVQYGKNSDEAKGLKGEIDKLSETLNKNKKEFEDLEKSSGAAGNTATDMVKQIEQTLVSAGITKLVGDISGAVIEMASEFSNSESIIVKATGATGSQLDSLSKSMTNVYSISKVKDMTAVAGAIGEINTRLGLQGQELERETKLFMDYAQITGRDVVGSVQNVTKVMKNWNVEVDGTESLLDKFALAGQVSGISVDSLSDSVIQNKATLQQLGYGLDESIALLSMFEYQGLNSSSIMMGFRSAVTEFAKDGRDASSAMAETITQIKNMGSESDATSLAVKTFGSRSGAELAYAIRNGKFEIEDWIATIGNADGTLAKTANAAATLEEKWTRSSNSMKTAFSNTLSPAVNAVSSAFASVVGGIGDFLNKSPVATAIITGLGVALVAVTGSLAVYKLATTAATVVTAMFGTSLKAALGPIGLVIAGIAAITTVGVLLYNSISEANKEFNSLTATSKENYLQMQDANNEYQKARELYGETADETLALRYRVDELTESYEANKKTHEQYRAEMDRTLDNHNKMMKTYSDSMNDIKDSETGNLALINKLSQLQAQTNLTAGEQTQMASIVDRLNEKLPNLGLSYDKVTNSINKSAAAMRKFAEESAEQQKQEAQTQAYLDAIAQVDDLLAKNREAKANLDAEKDLVRNSWYGKFFDLLGYDVTTDNLIRSWTKLGEYRDDLNDSYDAYENALQIIEETEAAYEAQAKAAEKAAEATKHITAAHSENETAVNKFKEANDALINSNKKLVDDYNSSIAKIGEEETGASILIEKLAALSGKTKLTAGEQLQMSAITDKLNSQMPGLALSYDKTTGALNRSVEAMKTAAKAEADKQKYAAQQNTYSDLLIQEIALEEKLAEAKQLVSDAEERYYDAKKTNPDLDYSELYTDIEAARDMAEEVRSAYSQNQFTQYEIRKSLEEQANAVVDYETAVRDAVSGVSDDLQKLIDDYDKTYEAANKSISSTVGLFNKMKTESDITTQQMLDNMQSQLVFIEKYESNLQKASQYGLDESLIASMSDGSKESAGYINAIVSQIENMKPEKAAEFVENFNKQFEGVKTAKDSFAATVAEMQTGFSGKMDEIQTRMIEAVNDMNMENDAANAAKKTIEAYIAGIKSGVDNLGTATGSAKSAVLAALLPNGIYSAAIPGYANGTFNAPNAYIAGERGPELIVGAAGSTVYPAEETAKILYAGDRIPLNVPVPENLEFSRHEIFENISSNTSTNTSEKKITIDLNGVGEIKVDGNLEDEDVWEIVSPRLKPEFIKIIRQEIFEEGDRAYNF